LVPAVYGSTEQLTLSLPIRGLTTERFTPG
jgi:hypothetical protein